MPPRSESDIIDSQLMSLIRAGMSRHLGVKSSVRGVLGIICHSTDIVELFDERKRRQDGAVHFVARSMIAICRVRTLERLMPSSATARLLQSQIREYALLSRFSAEPGTFSSNFSHEDPRILNDAVTVTVTLFSFLFFFSILFFSRPL